MLSLGFAHAKIVGKRASRLTPFSNTTVAVHYASGFHSSIVLRIHDLFLSGPLLAYCSTREVNMNKEKVRKDEEGWEPSTPDPLRKEDRSLDIGESGQFAPGGYYNQQAVTGRGRSHLDDLVPDENIEKSVEEQDKKKRARLG